MRTYLAERVEPGDEAFVVSQAFNPEFIQASVAFALYRTIEALNKPLTRPHAIVPREIIQALERKTNGSISRQQQDAHELFQIVSSALTAEEEQQFREAPATLFDANLVRSMAMDNVTSPLGMRGLGNMDLPVDQALLDKLETSSISSSMGSVSTMGSMWSAFSVSTVGGYLRPRSHRPRNPFTGLAARTMGVAAKGGHETRRDGFKN
ncbi:hypothetical protein BC937DRAFT_87720 [Endogone sp. FLAS-F59071]|nr:hypothetical protein BC937DRAFT_87720 [Endogone sp. FLAS-F59071]|eukprot:RUS12501.1 hypothetical protein BC937DRAFT_87720 [Endogone sp. FLAS-F59071]